MSRSRTLFELLAGEPDDAAIITADGWSISYASLLENVQLLAEGMRGILPRPDARIALALPNGPEALICFLAAAHAGAAAPLNPAYTADEFAFYLDDTDAGLLLLPEDGPAGAGDPAPEGCRVAAVRRDAYGRVELTVEPAAAEDAAPAAEDVALVLHTSGTTSRPKRVPLTHANLAASAATIAATYNLTPEDRSLCVMPLFHVHGLIASCLATFAAGGVVLLPGRFTPALFWQSLRELGPTWYSAVPTLHQLAISRVDDEDAAAAAVSLRFARSCSSALPPPLMQRLEGLLNVPVLEAYGMTEASHQMASNPLPPENRKPASVGRATGVDIGVMDAAGILMPQGETGEVVIRGPGVTAGYEQLPEANAEAFTGGWFRTGDLGQLDAGGYLYLNGRIKEMINRGGEKISPREIDEALLAHPAVAEAVAFGLPHAVWGEEVAAAVVLRGDAEERDLRRHCRELLADFKCPRRVFVVDAIPRTATGKIQRRAVAAVFQESQ